MTTQQLEVKVWGWCWLDHHQWCLMLVPSTIICIKNNLAKKQCHKHQGPGSITPATCCGQNSKPRFHTPSALLAAHRVITIGHRWLGTHGWAQLPNCGMCASAGHSCMRQRSRAVPWWSSRRGLRTWCVPCARSCTT